MNTSEVESIVYRKRVGNTYNILRNENEGINGRTIASDGTTYKVVERNGKKYLELDMSGNPQLKKSAKYVCNVLEKDGLIADEKDNIVHTISAATEVVREA